MNSTREQYEEFQAEINLCVFDDSLRNLGPHTLLGKVGLASVCAKSLSLRFSVIRLHLGEKLGQGE